MSCDACPAGLYTGKSLAASVCITCPSGRFSGVGSTFCTSCSPGQYTPYVGYSGCLLCFPGTSSLGGASTCVSCPAPSNFAFNCSLY